MSASTATIHKTTCCYCGVGCGIAVQRARDGRLSLTGDADHPGSRGLLCSKGRTLLHTVASRQDRLLWPQMRTEASAPLRRTTWDAAIARAAAGFARVIAEHGPDAVGFYVSGQCLTEEYYLANKLVKGFLGTNNIDTNSRLCMSSAVAAYKATLGADSVPTGYEDLDLADTFLIAGANPAWCHPIVFRRIEARKASAPDRVRIICIDPRRTATAAASDLHLPLRPGTDVALFHGLAAELWRTGQIDADFIAAHTQGWPALSAELEGWSLERAAAICGLPREDIVTAAAWLGGDRAFLSLWTMGLNQSAVGVDKNVALINLSLLTGKIGRPGSGPFSLTGQPNAMGGREVGGLANLLPAHRDLANPSHRQEVADFWGVPGLRAEPGLTAVEMFEAARSGRLKALWVMCTNPAASLPDASRVEEGLRALDLLVVQDIYPTETSAHAHLVLPAATWLEKTGTMTSSERRVTHLAKVVDPPGEALPDCEILVRFARALGHGNSFSFQNEAEIFAEHVRLTSGQDCDISGLSHDRLRQMGSAQWPVPSALSPGTPRLYTDHCFATPDGRARLAAPAHVDRSEPLDELHPLVLTTGRLRDQWHTMTKTGRVARLRGHAPVPFLEISPQDADLRGIHQGDLVEVTGRRGAVRVRAEVTTDLRPGTVFLPMHWGRERGGTRGRINDLTSPLLDPISKEPDLKFAAVQVTVHRPSPRRIVVVGAGAAALGLVEAHLRLSEGGRVTRDSLDIVGDEPEAIYHRVLLPHYIDGRSDWAGLVRATPEALADRGVHFRSGRRAVAIDRKARRLRLADGSEIPYDVLILATGSQANVPADGPLNRPGALGLRGRGDAEHIRARCLSLARERQPRVIIQGAGLLGLELADALIHLGCAVTILQRSRRLMGRQLDVRASAHLLEHLLDRGIDVRFDANLMGFTGDGPLTGARLDDDQVIPCDLFVFATGTRAETALARSAGLACAQGVLVDQHLRTDDPAIFAIGECAEHDGRRVGTTAGSEAQARCLAEYLRGNPHAPWRGLAEANILKLRGVQLATCGQVESDEDPSVETIVLEDLRSRLYQKAVIRNDRLVGIIMLGDTVGFAEHRELIESGTELEDLRARLLRLAGGNAGAKGRLVCSCNQVGEDDLVACVRAGTTDLAAVCSATRAGTSCGSCRGEIQAIVTRQAPALAARG